MSFESAERARLVEELVVTARIINRENFTAIEETLVPTVAMAYSLLRVGRRYLDQSLEDLSQDQSHPITIESCIKQMEPDRDRTNNFLRGLSFGLMGCSILRIEKGENYFIGMREYVKGTVIEPDIENQTRSDSIESSWDTIQENERLFGLVKLYPDLVTILADINRLPAEVSAHLNLIPNQVRYAFLSNVSLYEDALDYLQHPAIILSEQTAPFGFLTRDDQVWINGLLSDFK